ncbi:MAG: hypothetical protein US92_C0001G0191 [Candidatus Peregrinibacteria bacterium GW2011_GWA2_38_36]|nr:MAG: hypothetical protein US92_C0001G0191 [Candidatus Peregrinibacteria bacterium GW2011_GWA2_38_36]
MSAVKRAIGELGLKRVPRDLIENLVKLGDTPHFSHSLAVGVGVSHVLQNTGIITAPSMDGKSTVGLDKSAIATGALLHDIGKCGPPGVSYEDGKNPFVIVYGLVFSRPEFMEIAETDDPKKGSPSKIQLSMFLNHLVREKRITRTEASLIFQETRKVINRLNPEGVTLRDFYNAHVIWTRQRLDRRGIHHDTFLAAGGHHAARRFRFPNTDDRHSDEHAVRAGRLVEAVDSMQAVTGRRERGRDLMTFDEGLEGVKRMVRRASGLLGVIRMEYHEFLDDDGRKNLAEALEAKRKELERDGKKPKGEMRLRKDEIVRTGLLEEAMAIANDSVAVD